MTRVMKLYTVAGTSIKDGKTKIRFSRDVDVRTKTLIATGDSDINLVELPNEMTKLDAVKYLKSNLDFDQEHEQAAFAAFLAKQEPKAATAPATVEDALEDLADAAEDIGHDAELEAAEAETEEA